MNDNNSTGKMARESGQTVVVSTRPGSVINGTLLALIPEREDGNLFTSRIDGMSSTNVPGDLQGTRPKGSVFNNAVPAN